MKAAVSQSLYNYWNGLRRDRMAPRRFEIEPSCIANLLPDTFILERIDEKSIRFRLAGTRISDALGVDLRGVNVFDLFDPKDRPSLACDIAEVVSHGAVAVFEMEASHENGNAASFEIVLLPLTHTREAIDRFLGSITPLTKPDWLGTTALTKRCLLKRELVWPEGRPRTAWEHLERQLPFVPTMREAKIVRSERRQFRVYEGGLSGPKR